MIAVLVLGGLAALGALVVEGVRWVTRPEARRLRTIRKLDRR